MDADANKALIREVFAAWERGNVQAFFDVLADDVRWTVAGSCPISGTYEGKQAFFEGAAAPLFERLSGPIEPSLRNLVADRDYVVLQWDGQATTSTGERFDNAYCWVMRMRGGRVVEGMAYIDTDRVARLWSPDTAPTSHRSRNAEGEPQ